MTDVGVFRNPGAGTLLPILVLLLFGRVNSCSGSISFYPRSGWTSRMTGGEFQVSNDGVSYTTVYTIASQPADGQWTTVM